MHITPYTVSSVIRWDFSLADPSFDPSIALASLVQHIPVQMITVLIKSLTTDQNVKDANMTKALCRLPHTLSHLTVPVSNFRFFIMYKISYLAKCNLTLYI